jgi:hypothetical protein
MISVIVCSVQPGYLQQLKKNLQETIGVEYELLAYDNRNTKKGICAVYNEMAAKAKFDILCFAHEDILFETLSWGRELINSFESSFEVIGVAGSKYKSGFFSGWYTGNVEFDCANILHRFPDRDERISLNPSKKSSTEEVVCLDGVFISCYKSVWQQVLFDEKNLKGFHFYDIDFSLRCSNNHKVGVSFKIDIVHLTMGGDFGNNWVLTAIDYHQRNRSFLPVRKLKNSSAINEVNIAKTTLDVLKNQKISFKNKKKWIQGQKLYNHPGLYYSILKFLLYGPLKLNRVHKFFK